MQLFESPLPLFIAGILAFHFLLAAVAQHPWLRGAMEAGMAALAEMPAIAFLHRELSSVPWWAEGVLAAFGLVAAVILRMKRRRAPDVPKQTEVAAPTPVARETRNVLVIAPSIQITMPPGEKGVTPNVSVVVNVQSVVGLSTKRDREELLSKE